MTARILGKAIALWFLLAMLAVLNGGLRQFLLIPQLGPVAGLRVSGLLLCAIIFLLAWLTLPWYGPLRRRQYWLIGLLWLVMTVLFEFGFGHFIAHKSWTELFEAYDMSEGSLWIGVLFVTLVAPLLAARLRRDIRA